MPTPEFKLSLIVIMTTLFCRGSSQKTCASGWFGTGCKYKCWCLSNRCKRNGECMDATSCVAGWFGPSCQYNNLMTESTSDRFWSIDGNIGTCITGKKDINIGFQDIYHFSWLRIAFNGTALRQESQPSVDFDFRDISNNIVKCQNKTIFIVDDSTADFHCNMSTRINKITLRSKGISICEVYFNSGRNLALKQPTNQSSSKTSGQSSAAVDGSREANFNNKSCSHTNTGDTNPSFFLYYPRSVIIYRALVFNRNVQLERLQGFILKTFDVNGTQVDYYKEPGFNQSEYRVPFQKLKAIVKLSVQTSSVLTLCEVETYGEIICPKFKWGLDCLDDCHCKPNELCSPITGKCDTGCQPGFYGLQCVEKCPTNCLNGTCFRYTGICVSCQRGYNGNSCDTEIICPSLKWGLDCLDDCQCNPTELCSSKTGMCDGGCPPDSYGLLCDEQCPINCLNPMCFRITGSCLHCNIGYKGNSCDIEITCPRFKWGHDCSDDCKCLPTELCSPITGKCDRACPAGFYGLVCYSPCPTNCLNKKCFKDTGACLECVEGYMGDFCDIACLPDAYGTDCLLTCPSNCMNNSCDNSTIEIGDCSDRVCDNAGLCYACNDSARYGWNCTLECPQNCQNRSCHIKNGACHSCKAGFYGADCSKVCGNNCKDTCDFNSGVCNECNSTFYGENCSLSCPVTCANNDCHPLTGACNGCPNGLFGENCSEICSEKCKGQTCHTTNGSCQTGCYQGFFGANCSNDCSTKCKERDCHFTSGICSKGCEPGLFGKSCLSICPRRCKDLHCQFVKGSCNACDTGFYGLQCDFQCSDDCSSRECNINSGVCTKGGYTNYYLAVFAPIAVVIVLLLIVTIMICKHKEETGANELDESHGLAG